MTARRGRVVLLRPVAPAPASPPPERIPDAVDPPAVDDAAPAPPIGADVAAWRPAAALAAAVVLGASVGDGWVAVLALAVAGGPRVAVAAGLAIAATVARWGTADLAAVAGDQAVLGAAVATGPAVDALGSALAAVALLLVARPGAGPSGSGRARPARRAVVADPGGLALPAALGLGAAALAAGPAVGRAEDLLVRVLASVLGVALAVVVAHLARRDDRHDRLLGAGGLAAGLLAAALGIPS